MSNETKFTKGEWVVHDVKGSDINGAFTGVQAGHQHITTGLSSNLQHRANAHLISAAPDMYEALEALLEICHAEPHGEFQRHQAIKALKKARGEA